MQAAEQQATQQQQQQEQQPQEVKLTEVSVNSENVALNVMVGLLNLAQRRGAYNMEESAKAWECVKMFMRQQQSSAQSGESSLGSVPEENTVINA